MMRQQLSEFQEASPVWSKVRPFPVDPYDPFTQESALWVRPSYK